MAGPNKRSPKSYRRLPDPREDIEKLSDSSDGETYGVFKTTARSGFGNALVLLNLTGRTNPLRDQTFALSKAYANKPTNNQNNLWQNRKKTWKHTLLRNMQTLMAAATPIKNPQSKSLSKVLTGRRVTERALI